MVKQPCAGRVKTRLGRDIGMTQAAWWFRHQVSRLLREVQDPRWDLILSVAPDTALQSPVWPAHLPRLPQGRGDLGQRMAQVFRSLPPGPVCLIGGDIPGVRKHHIADAFHQLGNHDAVFGPATDGGYWLVGMKRIAPPPATLFQNVRWSTEHALSDSTTSMPGLRIARAATLRDVDTAADLRQSSFRTN
jgi:rSAM/selenodomain-associated transferase 1